VAAKREADGVQGGAWRLPVASGIKGQSATGRMGLLAAGEKRKVVLAEEQRRSRRWALTRIRRRRSGSACTGGWWGTRRSTATAWCLRNTGATQSWATGSPRSGCRRTMRVRTPEREAALDALGGMSLIRTRQRRNDNTGSRSWRHTERWRVTAWCPRSMAHWGGGGTRNGGS